MKPKEINTDNIRWEIDSIEIKHPMREHNEMFTRDGHAQLIINAVNVMLAPKGYQIRFNRKQETMYNHHATGRSWWLMATQLELVSKREDYNPCRICCKDLDPEEFYYDEECYGECNWNNDIRRDETVADDNTERGCKELPLMSDMDDEYGRQGWWEHASRIVNHELDKYPKSKVGWHGFRPIKEEDNT